MREAPMSIDWANRTRENSYSTPDSAYKDNNYFIGLMWESSDTKCKSSSKMFCSLRSFNQCKGKGPQKIVMNQDDYKSIIDIICSTSLQG